jgi:phosphoserine phosphatase
MSRIILQGASLSSEHVDAIAEAVAGNVTAFSQFYLIETAQSVDAAQLASMREQSTADINLLPEQFDPATAGLLVTDMDSTLISIECVDEIADFADIKPQVAAITESAMRGEIDFETSLRQRVGLLKGLDVAALEQVYEQRLQLNPGAEIMIKTLQQAGIKVALVSGGFTFFTERLKQRLGLDYTLANVLGEQDGKLTGEVVGDICGAQAKADFLHERCVELNLSPNQAIALGDGANDLLMMKQAGLSIAYHAKPTVQQQAATALNHSGLEGVLGLLQLDY